MTTVAFPGTFDPITLGHEAVARRAADIFGRLIVCVAAGLHKKTVFSHRERTEMARKVFAADRKIEVLPFDGLLADFLRRRECRIILRGLRALSDYEFETQFASVNKKLDPSLETLLFMPTPEYVHLSSSLVREIAVLGGDLEKFVSPIVAKNLRRKVGRKK